MNFSFNIEYAVALIAVILMNASCVGVTDGSVSYAPPMPLQKIQMEFVSVYAKGINFTMGSGSPTVGSCAATSVSPDVPSDRPETAHCVTLTHNFEMQLTDVTQWQYYHSTQLNPSVFRDVNDCVETFDGGLAGGMCPQNPVENISWIDAIHFANQASIAAGYEPCYLDDNGSTIASIYDCTGYRLPTEAEFEFAARAGTTTSFYFGENTRVGQDNLSIWEWYGVGEAGGTSEGHTHEVKNCPNANACKNPFGLYGISGNVWKWLNDVWVVDLGPDEQVDPTGPAFTTGSSRTESGGSWFNAARSHRTARRDYDFPDYHDYAVGFRLVRTLPN